MESEMNQDSFNQVKYHKQRIENPNLLLAGNGEQENQRVATMEWFIIINVEGNLISMTVRMIS